MIAICTGCPGKFGIAKTAGLAEMVGSDINLGTQGGYTMVPQTSDLPPPKKFLLWKPWINVSAETNYDLWGPNG